MSVDANATSDEGTPMDVYRELVSPARPRAQDIRAPAELRATHNGHHRRVGTGVRRLDDLLGGGFQEGSAVLLHGPPFTGKAVLQRLFAAHAVAEQAPLAVLLTDTAAAGFSNQLRHVAPALTEAESAGRIRYIDTYSRLIGGRERHPAALVVGAKDPVGEALRAVDEFQSLSARRGWKGMRLLVESASTLMLEQGSRPVLQALRVLVGRVRGRGGTVLLGLEKGMHPDEDVQAAKYLCDGMIHLREDNEKFQLRAEGVPLAYQPGWIDYEFGQSFFTLTGSFALGRIRGARLGL